VVASDPQRVVERLAGGRALASHYLVDHYEPNHWPRRTPFSLSGRAARPFILSALTLAPAGAKVWWSILTCWTGTTWPHRTQPQCGRFFCPPWRLGKRARQCGCKV